MLQQRRLSSPSLSLIAGGLAVTGVLGLGLLAEAKAAPAWCAGAADQRIDTSGSIEETFKDAEDPRNTLKNLVGRICKPDGEAREHQKELEAARQRWSKRLDLTEAEWADVADYATLGQGERMNGRVSINTNEQELGIGDSLKRPWSGLDPIDQYALLIVDSGASGDLSLDKSYLADAFGAKLSETGRFAYVQRCVDGSRNGPVDWAMCQRDVERLDFKKISAELRANKAYRGADKIRIRIEMDELKPRLPAHAAKVKKLIASDPGYAKVFELAAATAEEWTGRYQSNAALLALVSGMDDARATRSRKAFAGCQDKTWEAWQAALSEIPASKFEGMQDDRENGISFLDLAMGPLVTSPEAYLAGVAMMTCESGVADRGEEQDVLVRTLAGATQRWPGFRGPRNATQTAILVAGIELDDRDAKLEQPSVHREFARYNGSRSGGGAGVIGKLKPADKKTTVEFKKQMVKQVQCAQSKRTNRITQIRANGELVYETRCVKNETVVVDKSDAPQTVNPRYLGGVKPGMFASITEDVVIAVWAKPGAAKPTMMFGAKLK